MRDYPRLAERLFNRPLMVRPDVADTFARVFNAILAGQAPQRGNEAARPEPMGFVSNADYDRNAAREKGYIVTRKGVGLLSITGPLVQRAGSISADCMPLESYQSLSRLFSRMVADGDVRAILMEFDSPGGEVAGNFELANAVRNANSEKPVWAHANEGAFSAAFSLLVAADRTLAAETGMVGSIGVIMQAVSQVEKDKKAGYEYVTIFSGARKNDFNPHETISPDAVAWAQAEVDRLAAVFHQHVAAMRGITAQAVKDTEAAVFAPAAARDLRLIDGIATFADTLAELEQAVTRGTFSSPAGRTAARQTTAKEQLMSDTTPAATTPPPAPATESHMDAAAVRREATAAERTRVAAILNSEDAKGRARLATSIALETDMGVEAARKLLASAAMEGMPPAAAGTFQAAMANVPNPQVGADGGAGGGEEDADAMARRITGYSPK